MRRLVRKYLLRVTPKTDVYIADGTRGEFSKVTEEYKELKDAVSQKNVRLSFIECCDLIEAVLSYQWKQFRVPLFVSIFLVLIRRIYKPLRDKLYQYAGLQKVDFNSGHGKKRKK